MFSYINILTKRRNNFLVNSAASREKYVKECQILIESVPVSNLLLEIIGVIIRTSIIIGIIMLSTKEKKCQDILLYICHNTLNKNKLSNNIKLREESQENNDSSSIHCREEHLSRTKPLFRK